MNSLPSTREMERAYQQRDASYDGIFFLAVRTTSIVCRPSCPARKPLPRNVQYFRTMAEALRAGYRPCKRCRPLDTNGRPPSWLRPLLTEMERDPTARLTDSDLRARAIDPARVRRYFLKRHGKTFQAFCRERRMTEALLQIRQGVDLDQVALGHGYESHSGFREAFGRIFGQPPGRSRQTGCVVTTWLESPLGPLVVGATDEGICLLEFSDPARLELQASALSRTFAQALVPGSHVHLDRLKIELEEYFAGRRTSFEVPIVFPGSSFQRRVWEGLLQIPYGKTRSYEELALAIGAGRAQRAVGRANGQNRISIVIPCHRVINKGGKLGGYGGGLWRKQYLLDLERGVASNTVTAPDRRRLSSNGLLVHGEEPGDPALRR
jgi:AraC family transcriptional regulator of adaptative response/methylated-DNA-[protein]-cysteine methyltransferase